MLIIEYLFIYNYNINSMNNMWLDICLEVAKGGL